MHRKDECKAAEASAAIGTIEKNTDTFVLTYGQFSLIDAMNAILEQTGPAHVIISTWTAAPAHLDRAVVLREKKTILSLRLIIDQAYRTCKPAYFEHLNEIIPPSHIRELHSHSKFLIVYNENWNVVARTSMNLNRNPRLENIEISESKPFTNFMTRVVDDLFDEIAVGTYHFGAPKLKNIADEPQFGPVKGERIKTKDLKIAYCTHQIIDLEKNIAEIKGQ